MRTLNFPTAFGLATLSGCLWFLAVTPFDLAPLAWIASVPMLSAIDRAPSYRRALFLGWWAGVVETGGGFYWLIDVQQRFAEFPWIAAAAVFFAFCAARALIFLVCTAVICAVRRWRPLPMALLAPLAMVCGEIVVPQIFPCGQWISQAWQPLVVQISEVTGAYGVTALLMMVNGALYDLLRDRAAGRVPAACALVLLLACLGYGALRMKQVDAEIARAPKLNIGLVQPNVGYSVSGTDTREEILRQLHGLQGQSARLQKDGAKLILWSEGAYPIAMERDRDADYPEGSLAMIRRGFDVPSIIGAVTLTSNDDAYNSALLLDENGQITGKYDKVELLAFGEYVPGVQTFPWLRKLLPDGAGRFTPGSGPKLLKVQTANGASWQLAPVICYEDILQDYLSGVGRQHPNLLVNLTSDSWFGADTEPYEHLALSVFASVELRTSMVRAVNSGISALIDANGRVLVKTYADDPYRHPRDADGVVVSTPMMSASHTPFDVIGNGFAYLCALASLFLAGRAAFMLRRNISSPEARQS
jgi:apolipoprotein N-acyltransferase